MKTKLYFKKSVSLIMFIAFYSIINAQSIGAGHFHSIFTCSTGTIYSTGNNQGGQLGNGTFSPSSTPVQSIGLSGIIAVSGGRYHSLFIKNDNTVWSVGSNSNGQLGDGTTNNTRTTAVQVSSLSEITRMAAGSSHSLFSKNDGTVWSVGSNATGSLGDGTFIDKSTPIQITSLSGITKISGGGDFSIFLKNNGTVWSTGDNGFGQLGDGTMVNYRAIPVQVDNVSGIIEISAGFRHNLFLKSDGTVWSVGYNDYGQLGDGTSYSGSGPSNIKYSAVQVLGLTGIIAVSGGGDHSLFLKNNGTVWSVGQNYYGQLGDGTIVNKSTPVQVVGLTDVVEISAGYRHSLFLKSDGTVWAAGFGADGALGIFGAGNTSTPTQITGLCNVLEVEDFNYDNELTLYPNPTNGLVNFKTSENTRLNIKVYNAFGKQITHFNDTYTIDISNLTSGLYFVKLFHPETLQTTTRKIIKN